MYLCPARLGIVWFEAMDRKGEAPKGAGRNQSQSPPEKARDDKLATPVHIQKLMNFVLEGAARKAKPFRGLCCWRCPETNERGGCSPCLAM